MNRHDILELKLHPALKECQQHQLRLHAAWEEATAPPQSTLFTKYLKYNQNS